MKALFKRYHPPGSSPGTLAAVVSKVPFAIKLIAGRDPSIAARPVVMRRTLWTQRKVLGRLSGQECPCIKPDTRLFFRDCYDHTIQVMDLLDSYREMAGSMLEIYLSSLSNRLNESMRLLTMIATIFTLPDLPHCLGVNACG